MKLAAVLLLSWPVISLAQQVAIGEYNLQPQTLPANITMGPDNAMWFTGLGSSYGSVVGRIAPSGQFTVWDVQYTAYQYAITPGPDGALWFTEGSSGYIGRITTDGVISRYPIPTANTQTFGITAGPDGALWFTEGIADKIGRMTTAGVVTEYDVPTPDGMPGPITAGPDGALWFGFFSNNGNQIGRITTAGVFTMYPSPEGQEVYQIISGPDGALWCTDGVGVARITTNGVVTQYTLHDETSFTQGITVGLDGALWFTEETGNKIGRITTKGKITEYPVPTAGSNPMGIAAGQNGTLWFAEYTGDKIGEAFIVTADLLANPASGYYRSSMTFTGSGFAPNESVSIYKGGIGSDVLASATADATGAFTSTGRVPESAYGPRIFVAVGQTSGKQAAANFAITPRVIPTPDSGTPGSSTTVAGYGFGAYETVELFWNNPRSRLDTQVADIYGNVTFHITVPAKAPAGKNGVFGRGESTSAIGPGSFAVQ